MTETDGREAFLGALRGLGGSAGNARLRETLGWTDDTYDETKQALIADGQIVAWSGPGVDP
jgi:type I restriction enzyme M protein